MQNWIKWNSSSNYVGVFLYKNSSRTKHNRHYIWITDITVGFLINAALLNVYFILHCHLFFRKEIYFFECLYFSEYDIRMSLYIFWLSGWGREHQLSTYAAGVGMAGGWAVIQYVYSCVQEEEVSWLFYVRTYTTSFHCVSMLISSIISARKNDISFNSNDIQALK